MAAVDPALELEQGVGGSSQAATEWGRLDLAPDRWDRKAWLVECLAFRKISG